jgi:hypothetical protein
MATEQVWICDVCRKEARAPTEDLFVERYPSWGRFSLRVSGFNLELQAGDVRFAPSMNVCSTTCLAKALADLGRLFATKVAPPEKAGP